ncbi:hypothetical protein ANANG_G00291840 [Anguilla anguilla]|uniref:AIG1-type G domain-containing protein n=1 Tax=Anguilla anguilla TaxID=7936 RepID=A0A9D3LK66_ANGAN|nr:hypothetical protein ANANG_G00291840 [Anguilla anguilla]
MECDCKPESACTSTCLCETEDDITAALWMDYNSVWTGAIAVLGFLLYRFTQALPALIRWPIRLLCSFTGVTSMWRWVSRLVNTVLGLRTLFKWLCHLWKILVGSVGNMKKCMGAVAKLIQNLQELSTDQSTNRRHVGNAAPMTLYPSDPGLRLILVGPCVADLGLLRDRLLGCPASHGYQRQCVRWRAFAEGQELIMVDTPDILGSSLELTEVAREALRSLQLASPGPHAFLLVLRGPRPSDDGGDATKALRTLLDLVGEGALDHILLVLIHTDSPGGSGTPNPISEGTPGGLVALLSLCGQKLELLDIGPACPLARRRAQSQRLVERVVQMRALRGHYLHQLQRKENQMREELLLDAAAELRRRLEDKEREQKEREEREREQRERKAIGNEYLLHREGHVNEEWAISPSAPASAKACD